MRSSTVAVLVAGIFLFATFNPVFGGSRYHGHSYRSHHYNHKYYKPYRHHYNYHRYSSDDIWIGLGIGVVTGVLINAMTAPPPRTVIYRSPPPVIVHQAPAPVQYRRYTTQLQPSVNQVLRMVQITAPVLNVRFGPDLQTSIIARLPHGARVGVIGAAPDWLYIKTTDGQYGWVMTQYTQNAGGSSPAG